MSFVIRDVDSAFLGAGANVGLEIWCFENLQLIPVPKSSYGTFFCGSAYVVLNTALLWDGCLGYDIHYWLGNEAKEAESVLASHKALELDIVLGSHTVQYREVEGQETEKFLSYFKPCIIPVQGVFSSVLARTNNPTYKIRLFACKGDHAVSVKEVPFSRSSLNHNDLFVLDTASKIFLFCGCNSTIQERARALEVARHIKEENHRGKCQVTTIEDGKFVGDSAVGEFWSFLGGYAPIPKDSPSFFQKKHDFASVNLLWISTKGELCPCATDMLNREKLTRDKCYMLDCNTDVYLWMGKSTSITERKISVSAAEEFLRSEGRSFRSHLTVLAEGYETPKFRSYFSGWSHAQIPKFYEEGRDKVAAMFKQQGYNVKELPEEEYVPYIDCSGTLKVWLVSDLELEMLPIHEEIKIFSGNCYVLHYIYPDADREGNLFYAWLGSASVMEDRINAVLHMIDMADSRKSPSVLGQIMQDMEPDQFYWIVQKLVVCKGGFSSRHESLESEKGSAYSTFDSQKVALFRVQGTSPANMQAVQVNEVSSSLNSSYCYILQTESRIFTWIGNLTSSREHELLDRMLELINPTWQPLSLREGGETDDYWRALRGKADYPREKKIEKHAEDPHLFLWDSNGDDLKVKEIFNFTQDDLTTEDVFILDCSKEMFVWIGRHSNMKSKEQAFRLGQKYLEADALMQGLSLDTPIYIIMEGHEPQFFTCFFAWDYSKSYTHGNSFERKLALLREENTKQAPARNLWRVPSLDTKPNRLRSKSAGPKTVRNGSLASSFSGSQSPAANGSRLSSSVPFPVKVFPKSSPNGGVVGGLPRTSSGPAIGSTNMMKVDVMDDVDDDTNSLIYPYERLKVSSSDPVSGIDFTKREAYLSKEEFHEKFGMIKKAYYTLPKWKQNRLKMSVNLF